MERKFRFQVLIRTNNPYLISRLVMLGYEPEYLSNYEYNIQGKNIVCEFDRYHATDSDNKPHCIDCGTDEFMFLTLAMIKSTDIPFINTDGLCIATKPESLPEGEVPATDEEIINYLKSIQENNKSASRNIFGTCS